MSARRADVAVVGGGVLGCAAALHLKLLGCENVTLIERDRIGGGTSSAGAGLLARWSVGFVPAWGDDELQLETYGLDFYRDLADQGHELGYVQSGTLFVGSLRRSGSRSLLPLGRHGDALDLALLTPEDVEELTAGFVQAAGIAGGVFDRSGARVWASAAARALARRFADLGGVPLEHEPVTSVRVGRTGGFVLETASGQIACQKLVVAAGGWTNAFLRAFGVWLPLVPLVATRLRTEPRGLPPSLPAIQFCDGERIYIREDGGRLIWGCHYEGHPRYAFVGRDLPDSFEALPLVCIAEMKRAAAELATAVPSLAGARTERAAHGAPCFTPDLKPLIGELGAVPGLYVLAGDNYAGVTHAPGAGRLLAELATDAPNLSIDPLTYRPERFHDEYRHEAEVLTGMRWTTARTLLTARATTLRPCGF